MCAHIITSHARRKVGRRRGWIEILPVAIVKRLGYCATLRIPYDQCRTSIPVQGTVHSIFLLRHDAGNGVFDPICRFVIRAMIVAVNGPRFGDDFA